jgi:zinc protease
MSILADVVRQPTFKDDEIERLRQQYIDSLTLELMSQVRLHGLWARKFFTATDLHGHPISGTLESLKRISRSDILKVHRLFYRPDNAILLIGGDINSAAGFSLATRFFGGWLPRTPVPILSAANKTADQQTVVAVIDKPDAGQAAVFLIRRGIDRRDTDYYRGIVTNSVLNGYSAT